MEPPSQPPGRADDSYCEGPKPFYKFLPLPPNRLSLSAFETNRKITEPLDRLVFFPEFHIGFMNPQFKGGTRHERNPGRCHFIKLQAPFPREWSLPDNCSAFRYGAETFHALKKILAQKGYATSVGDEDGLAENDWDGSRSQTAALGNKIQIVGDDIYVTDKHFMTRGIREKTINAVLILRQRIGFGWFQNGRAAVAVSSGAVKVAMSPSMSSKPVWSLRTHGA